MSKEEIKQPELTPDIARACLEFLSRAQLQGKEAHVMVEVQRVISGFVEQ